jgi:hypothetical protein
MKKCPECSRTYSDDTLSFCLEDGALLSASYDPNDTSSPTVAITAPDIPPTVEANQIPPTVAMQDIPPTVASNQIAPTTAAQEIPTVVANARTPQTEDKKVRWYIYLAGFFIAFVYHIVMIRVLAAVLRLAGLESLFRYDAFVVTMTGIIIFGSLGVILGFIWFRAKWKWGLVIVWSELLVLADYYYRSRFSVGFIVGFLFLTAFACAASWLGSSLRRKISKTENRA